MPRKMLEDPLWVHPDDLHLTLRYIGDIEEENLPLLQEALAGVRFKSFSIEIKGLAAFHKRWQSILYADIKSRQKLTTLTTEITDKLNGLGYVFPERNYSPHITIARVKKKRGMADYIESYSKKIHAAWAVDSFSLFRSAQPGETGRRYSVIERYRLVDY